MTASRTLRFNIYALGLLLIMAMLAGSAAWRESVAVDEVAHVGAGVSYLQKLDYRMNEEHPPLAKVIAAIPLVIKGVRADYAHLSWSFSGKPFHQYLGEWVWGHALITEWNDPWTTLRWARFPMLLLTLTLGWMIYAYGSKLGGNWAGLLCLVAYVTTPAFLVFGPLVVTDVAITLFSLLSMWTFADLWRDPSRQNIIKFALAFAGALLSKFSAGLLLFGFAAFTLSLRFKRTAELPTDKLERRKWRRRRSWSLAKGVFLGLLVVYVVYFVLTWNQPTDSYNIIPHFPASPLVRRLLMPPWTYLKGLALFSASASRAAFILGRNYPSGVWFYFPVLFFLKSQIAFVLLLAVSAVTTTLAKRRTSSTYSSVPEELRLHWRAIWMFFFVFVAACLISPMTISIRHFTVPIALMILMLAPLPRAIGALRQTWAGAARFIALSTAGLALILVIAMIRAYPNYVPFLSSFGMGKPAYELMSDSNLDWNHALPEVERFAEQRGLTRVLIDEYGFSKVEVYVRNGKFWNCQDPAETDAGQLAVVSAAMIEDGHNCVWLLKYPHEPIAAGSMYVFHLPQSIPAQGSPGGPPPPDQWRNLAGFPLKGDIRRMFLNCINDPNQMQPTFDSITAQFTAMMEEQKRKKKK